MMEYDFIKAIEEVIENCRLFGSGRVQRKDDDGNITLWLETEWVEHPDGEHDVIELYISVIAILGTLPIVNILRKQ